MAVASRRMRGMSMPTDVLIYRCLISKLTEKAKKKKRVAITSSGAAFGICINWPKTKKKRQTKIGGNYREPNETRRNEKGQWNRSFLRDWRRFPSLSSREVLYNEWREPRGHRCPEQLDVTICLASDKSIWGYMPAAEITNQTTTSFKITLKSFLKKKLFKNLHFRNLTLRFISIPSYHLSHIIKC